MECSYCNCEGLKLTCRCRCHLHDKSISYFTLADIRKFCLKYDHECGSWPESKYEGMAIYEFICEELDNDGIIEFNYNDPDVWAEEMKNA